MANIQDEFPGDGFQGDIDYLNSDYNAGEPAEIRLLKALIALGAGTGTAQLAASTPALAKGAYGVLKGLGNAGEMALGGTPEAVQGAKAVNAGLKALTTPEEMAEIGIVGQKGPFPANLIQELKDGLKGASIKDEITLSNGSKWRFDGVQKGASGQPGEVLLEHLEGPVPEGVRQGVSTTLSTLESKAAGAPAIAQDIAAQKALNLAEDTGGATFNLAKGDLANTPHYAVFVHPDRELILDGEVTTKQIESYIAKNQDLLNDPLNSLGIWKDTESGKTYLDVTATIPDKADAMTLGVEHGQKAIFDLGNMKEIRLKEK